MKKYLLLLVFAISPMLHGASGPGFRVFTGEEFVNFLCNRIAPAGVSSPTKPVHSYELKRKEELPPLSAAELIELSKPDKMNEAISKIVAKKNYWKFQSLIEAGIKIPTGETFWHCMALYAPFEDFKLWTEQEGLVVNDKLTDKGKKFLNVIDSTNYLPIDLTSFREDFRPLDYLIRVGVDAEGYSRLHFAALRLNQQETIKTINNAFNVNETVNRLNNNKCNALEELVFLHAKKVPVSRNLLLVVETLLTAKSKLGSTSQENVLIRSVNASNFELLDHILNCCQDPIEILTFAPGTLQMAKDMHTVAIAIDRDKANRLASCIASLKKAIAKAEASISNVFAVKRGEAIATTQPKTAADSEEKKRKVEEGLDQEKKAAEERLRLQAQAQAQAKKEAEAKLAKEKEDAAQAKLKDEEREARAKREKEKVKREERRARQAAREREEALQVAAQARATEIRKCNYLIRSFTQRLEKNKLKLSDESISAAERADLTTRISCDNRVIARYQKKLAELEAR